MHDIDVYVARIKEIDSAYADDVDAAFKMYNDAIADALRRRSKALREAQDTILYKVGHEEDNHLPTT